MLPAYFRFSQCLRRYRDSKEASPHLANAGNTITLNYGFNYCICLPSDSEICNIILRHHFLLHYVCDYQELLEFV